MTAEKSGCAPGEICSCVVALALDKFFFAAVRRRTNYAWSMSAPVTCTMILQSVDAETAANTDQAVFDPG